MCFNNTGEHTGEDEIHMTEESSSVYKRKRRGPSMDPLVQVQVESCASNVESWIAAAFRVIVDHSG